MKLIERSSDNSNPASVVAAADDISNDVEDAVSAAGFR